MKMDAQRLQQITDQYSKLRIAVVGDFCLDRYLEIDPNRQEMSIETGLPVHNVVSVRAQPGGAGTILNNLCALGVKSLYPVGFCGSEGEGFELQQALAQTGPVVMDHFFATQDRCTFTYAKPLVVQENQVPEELSRLDMKNWTPTPPAVEERLCASVEALAGQVDAMVLLEQTDVAETGVITQAMRRTIQRVAADRPDLWIIADSRRGLEGYPSVCFKMNRDELKRMSGVESGDSLDSVREQARSLAQSNGRSVFVTLAEGGILAADAVGRTEHVTSLPVEGEIDIVGAGDAVTANLVVALAAGATLAECLQLANTAASVVIHQLGTTGTASVEQIKQRMMRE